MGQHLPPTWPPAETLQVHNYGTVCNVWCYDVTCHSSNDLSKFTLISDSI